MRAKDIRAHLDDKGNTYIEVLKKGKLYKLHYDRCTPKLQSFLFHSLYARYIVHPKNLASNFVIISSGK